MLAIERSKSVHDLEEAGEATTSPLTIFLAQECWKMEGLMVEE